MEGRSWFPVLVLVLTQQAKILLFMHALVICNEYNSNVSCGNPASAPPPMPSTKSYARYPLLLLWLIPK